MQACRLGQIYKKVDIIPVLYTRVCGLKNLKNKSTRISLVSADPSWRIEKKLPKNPNAYGPLTDGPDFSYLDGRPIPLSQTRKMKLEKQQVLAERAVMFLNELNFAKERKKNLDLKNEQIKKQILDKKLKAKGNALTDK